MRAVDSHGISAIVVQVLGFVRQYKHNQQRSIEDACRLFQTLVRALNWERLESVSQW